jgi:hypothetical protein
MKPFVDVVIVIPIGPNSDPGFIIDTMESYVFYTQSTYAFVLADDSHQGVGAEVKKAFPDAAVLLTDKPMGGWAGLYINLARSFAYALEHYEFKVLLKLDTDALIIGAGLDEDAIRYFEQHPKAGIAGQYPNDYQGHPWDLGWPRRRILNGTSTWKFIKRPKSNLALIPLHRRAKANGYRTGESVFGGAYFMSRNFLQNMYTAGHLPNFKLQNLNLGEDHLFSLLAKTIGYSLGSLSGSGQPFGMAWKGLPVSPEQLIADEKKITHSVRYWQHMDEAAVRQWFRQKRTIAESVPVFA